jgi:UDP-glucuronate 4-epimerase
MKHVLVTGAAGFIGSHLVDALLADGWRVTAVDSFDPFYAPSIKEQNVAGHLTHPNYALYRCDIRDTVALEGIATCFDAIVHLAARAGVRPSIADPRTYQDVNVTGTQNLLELARQTRTPHVVFASSSSVYGVNPQTPWRETDSVLRPISPYASTKVSGELLGHVYSHLYGMRFLALRFFTVYGPRQRPDLAIHNFARKMLAGTPIPVFGDGTTSRDYTYIADIVAGIRGALAYDRSRYELINLGNDRTITLTGMITELERALGVTARIDRQPEQPGDVPHTWACVDTARALLGYRPETPFAEGIDRFCQWLRDASNPQPVVIHPVSGAV